MYMTTYIVNTAMIPLDDFSAVKTGFGGTAPSAGKTNLLMMITCRTTQANMYR